MIRWSGSESRKRRVVGSRACGWLKKSPRPRRGPIGHLRAVKESGTTDHTFARASEPNSRDYACLEPTRALRGYVALVQPASSNVEVFTFFVLSRKENCFRRGLGVVDRA